MGNVIRITDELLAMMVGELDLPAKVINRLESVGIHTVMELMYCCARMESCDTCDKVECNAEHKLVDIQQFGKSSIDEIFVALMKASQDIME